jgi:hypothetical protein
MSMTKTPTRWDRLAADLAEIGVEARVDEKSYAEAVYGRVEHGVSRSVTLRHPGGGLVCVRDGWWRKNPDVWIGWSVSVEGSDGIVRRTWRNTKKRAEVAAAVREALALDVTA